MEKNGSMYSAVSKTPILSPRHPADPGSQMPPPCPTSWGQGFTTWSQHGRLIPSSKSGQKSGFNPSFSTLATNHSNNHRAWANLTGKVQPTDYRFSTSIWEEAEPSKDMRRPGRGRKMRRQHAGRNKDIQSQLRRNRSEERRVGKECRSRWSPYH